MKSPTLLLSLILSAGLNAGENPLLIQLDQAAVQLNFQKIPAATFEMGSQLDELERQPDELAHSVTISADYYLATHELTQSQWFKLMGTTPQQQFEKYNKRWPLRGTGDQHPMYLISWDECQELCKKLNQLAAAQLPAGYQFSLPTEAQWEYAAKSGTPNFSLEILPDLAWFRTTSKKQVHPVGHKKPNLHGLFDMHGNVSEWCLDWYAEYPAEPVIDPAGPTSGDRRVCRGGSWFGKWQNTRPSRRFHDPQDQGFSSMGVRLCLSKLE